MSTEKKLDIDQLGKFQYTEIAQANARIEELEVRIISLLATVEREHSGLLSWKKTAAQKDVYLIGLEAQIASAQQQDSASHQIRFRANFGDFAWGIWRECSADIAQKASDDAKNTNWESRKLYAAPVIPKIAFSAPRTSLIPMLEDNEQVLQWYFDCGDYYIDVSKDDQGLFSIFFRDKKAGGDGWLDQAEIDELQDTLQVKSLMRLNVAQKWRENYEALVQAHSMMPTILPPLPSPVCPEGDAAFSDIVYRFSAYQMREYAQNTIENLLKYTTSQHATEIEIGELQKSIMLTKAELKAYKEEIEKRSTL